MTSGNNQNAIVLVVDGDDESSAVCRAVTEKCAAMPVRVTTMQGALETVEHSVPDVAIVAHDLADGSALDCIKGIRNHPARSKTPIILLTREISPAELERAVMTGIYAFLTKPFSEDEFHRLLSAALEESQSQAGRSQD
jgi:two-component system, chemotaxis family, chemotaxis protein CheY